MDGIGVAFAPIGPDHLTDAPKEDRITFFQLLQLPLLENPLGLRVDQKFTALGQEYTHGDRVFHDAEQLALATGAAAYRWEDLTKAPVSPSMLLNPRRYGDGAKDLWTTLNCVQENIIRGGQRDRSRRRPDGSRMPKSRAIKGVDEDMKLNKARWEMAEVLRHGGAQ
jgi:hypothetical protein